ncbi:MULTISPECIES: hypothetical protein [Actinokineospora]|uniref:Uncharacterized protein n=2 Tax=Actinokineospora TaxID=39845 RepID=A0A421AXI1_9PSEU|nr:MULTISPECIES: hypothetical protein [Actinokineospora]RLK54514.1 hypothetical protein CLV68_5547 [Actinokineospora cianjurensis]SES11868.1 hypothetical protein SAMN04487818_107422 [Actinokineospora terrae]
MATSRRAMPLAGAAAAALVLAGVAVFTVSNAGCASAGEFVQRGQGLELVGGCVDPADLPPASSTPTVGTNPGSAVERFHQVSP